MKNILDKYEAVVGLEVHAQLKTNTKIFCGCSTQFGNNANSNICPVCLGHPGVLPVLNKKVVDYAIMMGLATNCSISPHSVFARKNYFYPDLPKGYQISQYEKPICENGKIDIEFNNKKIQIRITRIHIEEDAGKSIHEKGGVTRIDVNRCGTPLIEIVSEPDLCSGNEASLYLQEIKKIVQYLDICDGNMEEGSLRCDANISVRLKGEKKLGTKTEVKNMNSFRFVEKAIDAEILRQVEIIEDGGKIIQQTLLYDEELNDVFPMRSKEEAHDYRYFPDPDLVRLCIDNQWIKEIENALPELPAKRKERFEKAFNLPEYDARVLTQTKSIADYYEKIVSITADYKSASNWVMGDILKTINEQKTDISEFAIPPAFIARLIEMINGGLISNKIAKDVFVSMLIESKSPDEIVKEKNLVQISDSKEIEKIVCNILDKNETQVQEYLSGKEKVFGFFVGQIMKTTNGKANPSTLNIVLKNELEKRRNFIFIKESKPKE